MTTITDMFCGAGGSTTGATLAGGIVALAINHWKRAIETHNRNYPSIKHALTDLHAASPRKFPRTDILMASPECTSHSLAKGKKRKDQSQLDLWEEGPLSDEAEERSRCTMWTPLDWAEAHDYQAVVLENVVDAHLWRPFESWLHAWKSLDYDFQIVYLNSMHAHPTPQSRDRMYFVAWKRKNRKPDLKITPLAYCPRCEHDVESVQSWKNPLKKYGKYRQQYVYCCPGCAREVTPYYYCAANAIDWSLPTQRIADRKKPLREKTLVRIKYGLEKFAGDPLSVGLSYGGSHGHVSTLKKHLPTITTRQDQALIMPPFLMHLNHGDARPASVEDQPFPTQTSYDSTGLVMPHNTWLMSYYNNGSLTSTYETVPTVTTLERHALITAEQNVPAVEDCGFRMLDPEEIKAAMAFPKNYVITGTRREQVKQAGNAVTPPAMRLVMERVLASLAA